MSDIDRYDLHTLNATAYFETRAAADAAVNDLVAGGIARDQISVAGTGAFGTNATPGDRSFWEELKDLPAFARRGSVCVYAEGLPCRGGVVVSVRTKETDYERALRNPWIGTERVDLDKVKKQAGEKKAGQVIRVKTQRRPPPQPACLPKEIWACGLLNRDCLLTAYGDRGIRN